MSTRITGVEGVTALYDSTTGIAFGPVFDDDDEAQEFLEWLSTKESQDATFKLGNEEIRYLADPRVYRIGELQHAKRIFDTLGDDDADHN